MKKVGPCEFRDDNQRIKDYMRNTLGVITAVEDNKLKQEILSVMGKQPGTEECFYYEACSY